MTMVIPTLTPLPAGYVVQLADLQALTAAVTFMMSKPIARVHTTTAGGAISSAGSAVAFDTLDFDPDGMWDGVGKMIVQTPGYYKARYVVNQANVTGDSWVTVTNGVNNPGTLGAQQSYLDGYVFGSSASTAAGASGIIPSYLYQLDYVQVFFKGTTTSSVGVSPMGPYFAMEFVSA